ncbi:helix-turn-helix transcriptional regulator [Fusobacterium polymorphum]|uniref:helix-turn-helix transcriptional regulator n=1 Tax=Fusobacterium nucleatum subsp. polymorphum TaxID=76857 RepID=UPI002063AF9D|nr:MAG TPA: transposase [Caudoviricetes sp.]
MSIKEEVYKLLVKNKSTREIAEILNVSMRAVQKHKKKFDEANNSEQENEQRTTNKKEKKVIAKVLIETGASIKEASEKVGLAKSTVGDISSKGKLQFKQLEYLNNLRENYIERINKNKADRLEMNDLAKKKILDTLNSNEEITKSVQQMIKMNEQTEQEILELNRIERLEKFQLEKAKYKDTRLLIITEELANLSDADIEKILKIIEKSKADDENAKDL